LSKNLRMSAVTLILAAAFCVIASEGRADRGPGNGGARVEGKVKAVDLSAATVTIGATTVKVVVTTKIERNDRPALLADFKVGDFGQARFDATTKVASKV